MENKTTLITKAASKEVDKNIRKPKSVRNMEQIKEEAELACLKKLIEIVKP